MNAGTVAPHRSVLYQECIAVLSPTSPKRYLDCTAGAGGDSWGILKASSPNGEVLALDLDPLAVSLTQARLAEYGLRAKVIHGSYRDAAQILQEIGWENVDGILLDLGVSSMQFDQIERGFSFRGDAPLDMRFDPGHGQSAAELIESSTESELADLLWKYGEERASRRIARAIKAAGKVESTLQLAAIIRSATGRTQERQDPATRTFQALRIAVNAELQTLEAALPDLAALLKPGGRIAVISFHSLEDRIVKHFFKRESQNCVCPPEQPFCTCQHKASLKLVNRHPILPSEEEILENPRARSAKLRAAEKI
ncbi:MAG: 16S rRNA (cytosine(1402)-N(4))-methyltransferase RsmH [Anaerolineaceae bacterium]|nr:16S rRNA (cytosine(1402)-N(4))-methyltransferase RsmH [Anaerolineaceae bacterium]